MNRHYAEWGNRSGYRKVGTYGVVEGQLVYRMERLENRMEVHPFSYRVYNLPRINIKYANRHTA